MKLQEILESNVVSLDDRRGTSNRKYTSSDGDLVADQMFLKQFRDSIGKEYGGIEPVDVPPKVNTKQKRYTPTVVEKVIKPDIDAMRSQMQEPFTYFIDIQNDTDANGNHTVNAQTFVDLSDTRVSKEMAKRITKILSVRISEAIVKAFGSMVKQVRPLSSGVHIVLDKQTGAKPSVEHILTSILQKHNLFGVGTFFTNKLKSGFRTKILGIELPDSTTLKRLEDDIKEKFGPLFIKMTNDGEIKLIGQREVPEGLTNLRIFFKPDLIKHYRK